jgi:outer membrane PBP1 activator LpoA protein
MYKFTLSDIANLSEQEQEQLKAMAAKAGVKEGNNVFDAKAYIDRLNKQQAEEEKHTKALVDAFC